MALMAGYFLNVNIKLIFAFFFGLIKATVKVY